MAEKIYKMHLKESELQNQRVKKALRDFLNVRLNLQKTQPFFVITEAEWKILSDHPNWVDVKAYNPTRKGRLTGEVGKFRGKKVVVK